MNKMTAVDAEKKVAKRAAPKRKLMRLALMLIVPALLLLGGGYYWLVSDRYVSTDNAAVKQDIVGISAQVSGPVIEVAVRENQRVKRGDLLFRIDPEPYRVALLQAQAQLAAARLQTSQLSTQAAGTGADIVGAEADLAIKRRALSRQAALLKRGFTTRADYDDSVSEVRKSETELADARARAANANAALAPGEQPSIAQAEAAVAKARLDLSRTELRAPSDGIIANSDRLQIGQTVVQGVSMLSLVRSNQAWVEANFKERDLDRMKVGQKVKIEIDAYGGEDFTGHVASIGAGTGSEFALIPSQNANGNWVKVTQRVPVRIAFDGIPDRPMIAGLSATTKVYVK
jgi:membrane fusion protein (multidrug efflux system)